MPTNVVTEDERFLMTNVTPKESGLPVFVWIAVLGDIGPDTPILRVANVLRGPFVASVSVNPPVRVVVGHLDDRDLRAVARWIRRNRRTILRHWRGEIDSLEALNSVKPHR